jgi:nitroreductase
MSNQEFDTDTRTAVFAQIVKSRRSVRGFLPTPLPTEQLEAIFALANAAPSNCNVQPWLTHVASGAALDRLRGAMSTAFANGLLTMDFPFTGLYQGVYKDRQNDSARQLYGAMEISREDKAARNYEFFGAPHAAFVFMDEAFGLREAADVGMYGQTLMLALAAHGIASCAQAAVSFCADTVREQLSIPSNQKLLFGISFGYEDTTVPANSARTDRCALTEIATFYQ